MGCKWQFTVMQIQRSVEEIRLYKQGQIVCIYLFIFDKMQNAFYLFFCLNGRKNIHLFIYFVFAFVATATHVKICLVWLTPSSLCANGKKYNFIRSIPQMCSDVVSSQMLLLLSQNRLFKRRQLKWTCANHLRSKLLIWSSTLAPSFRLNNGTVSEWHWCCKQWTSINPAEA